MQRGTIPAGECVGLDACWERDILPECHNDNTLWGYAICNSDVLHQERESVNNLVSSSEPGGDHGDRNPQVVSKGVGALVVSSSCQQS